MYTTSVTHIKICFNRLWACNNASSQVFIPVHFIYFRATPFLSKSRYLVPRALRSATKYSPSLEAHVTAYPIFHFDNQQAFLTLDLDASTSTPEPGASVSSELSVPSLISDNTDFAFLTRPNSDSDILTRPNSSSADPILIRFTEAELCVVGGTSIVRSQVHFQTKAILAWFFEISE